MIHVAYSLAYLGSKPYSVAASLSGYMRIAENSYVPWKTFGWHMNKVASLLEHRPVFRDLSVRKNF